MNSNDFSRAKILISTVLKNLPRFYIIQIYEKINDDFLKYNGDKSLMIYYLNVLYKSDYILHEDNIYNNQNINYDNINDFKIFLKNNINNICYRANVGGYNESMEQFLSLKKTDLLLNENDVKLLFECYTELENNMKINSNRMNLINRVNIYSKYKLRGNRIIPSNYRFLFDHHKFYKILDKLISFEIIDNLEKKKKIPDKNIYCSNVDRSYSNSIRDIAYSVVKNNNDIILLDISKAFDNLEWNFVENKLSKYLNNRIGVTLSNKIVKKYMFMIKNRRNYYENIKININKGLPTGLCSSNLIFTLLFECVFDEIINYLSTLNIKIGIDYLLKIFVDDICIKIINKEKLSIIFNSVMFFLKYNHYDINSNKCKCSPNLNLNLPKIKDGDFYLGLPFSSSVKSYLDSCLIQFKNRHINIDYKDIKRLLKLNKFIKDNIYLSSIIHRIQGFFQYKLYGLKKYNIRNDFDNFLNILNNYY